eukprot:CAMPEP_0117558026 /NCGR_PEP_ID=MMETSP0784-20121206/52624_1 /TAXON_ID=39447 /ORGANISM="" /LENGTH=85 /DNA_ID=CAMNT_0005355343 /DNA_START=354 /DNA_END=607 /DNA_ORIENTATION=+
MGVVPVITRAEGVDGGEVHWILSSAVGRMVLYPPAASSKMPRKSAGDLAVPVVAMAIAAMETAKQNGKTGPMSMNVAWLEPTRLE